MIGTSLFIRVKCDSLLVHKKMRFDWLQKVKPAQIVESAVKAVHSLTFSSVGFVTTRSSLDTASPFHC